MNPRDGDKHPIPPAFAHLRASVSQPQAVQRRRPGNGEVPSLPTQEFREFVIGIIDEVLRITKEDVEDERSTSETGQDEDGEHGHGSTRDESGPTDPC